MKRKSQDASASAPTARTSSLKDTRIWENAKSAVAIWKSKPSWPPNPAHRGDGKNHNMTNAPTDTEIALTVAGTICVMTIKQLLHDYENLAAKHGVIPSPNMQSAVESTIFNMTSIFAVNPNLGEIFETMLNDVTEHYNYQKYERINGENRG